MYEFIVYTENISDLIVHTFYYTSILLILAGPLRVCVCLSVCVLANSS